MIISIFALIVFTTAAFEKFILEKKYQYQKKEVDITSYENEKMLKEYKKMCEDYDILSLKYSKLKKKG